MAFPVTSVLDNFNRADGALGSNWTTPIWLANSPRIVSNAVVPNVGNNYCDAYWNPATYGDCEVYATLTTYGSYNWVSLRLGDAGNNYDGYFADTSGGATSTINRRDNGVNTRLGATIAQVYASGDSIGLEAIGSTITLYRKTGGSWGSVASRTDATYTTGNIGFGVYNSSVLDDFSGGDVGGGTPQELAGVANGAGTSASGLLVQRRLAGVSAGLAAASLVLRVQRRLAGTGAGAGTAAAGLLIERHVAGLAQGAGTASAGLVAAKRLAGTASGAGSASASAAVGKRLAASAAGSSVITAALSTGEITLAGVASGGATAIVDLRVVRAIAVAVAGAASASGGLTVGKRLAGVASGAGSATVALTAGVTRHEIGTDMSGAAIMRPLETPMSAAARMRSLR